MSLQPDFAEQLAALLTQCVAEACLLEQALEREGAALARRDLDGLHDAIAQKRQHVATLEQASQAQNALLRSHGYETNAHGMETCLRDWDQEGQLRSVWERLAEVMQNCRRLNQINGGVVESSRHRVEQAIQILRGGESPVDVYGPHGRSISNGHSRSIAQA